MDVYVATNKYKKHVLKKKKNIVLFKRLHKTESWVIYKRYLTLPLQILRFSRQPASRVLKICCEKIIYADQAMWYRSTTTILIKPAFIGN